MDPADPDAEGPAVLALHLRSWLGAWPPRAPVEVVGADVRTRPGWDGVVHPVTALSTPAGAVVSVPPAAADAVRAALAGVASLAEPGWRATLPDAVGLPGTRMIEGIFRFCVEPADLDDAGVWLPVTDPAVPPWLHPFGGRVLVALDGDGRYLAGVGLKHHDRFGREIAVGTEEAARGRGLARRLVAQAARAVAAEGAIATYQHAFDNTASAHVADAAGFPDLGWRSMALIPGAAP